METLTTERFAEIVRDKEICEFCSYYLDDPENYCLSCDKVKPILSTELRDYYSRLKEFISDGYTARIIELLQADDEKRLLVLPCNVGDTVYVIRTPDCKSGECKDVDTENCKYSRFKTPNAEVNVCRHQHLFVDEVYVEEINCIVDQEEEEPGVYVNDLYHADTVYSKREEAEAALVEIETEIKVEIAKAGAESEQS